MKGEPLEIFNFRKFFSKFSKKRQMRILNSLIVPKYLKGETLWAFWHFSLLQNIKKNLKVGSFEGKKNSKKSSTVPKKNRPLSQMLEKVSG